MEIVLIAISIIAPITVVLYILFSKRKTKSMDHIFLNSANSNSYPDGKKIFDYLKSKKDQIVFKGDH